MTYDKIAKGYNELHGEEQVKKAEIIKEVLLKKKQSGLLLDIGGGTGISTEVFVKEFDCIILDPCEELLEEEPATCVKILGSAEELPFSDKKFDVIISLTALHHADLTLAFKEIKRVAKDDAFIAISFLKQAKNIKEFETVFRSSCDNVEVIDEGKDLIFFNS